MGNKISGCKNAYCSCSTYSVGYCGKRYCTVDCDNNKTEVSTLDDARQVETMPISHSIQTKDGGKYVG